jgi:hypothetical protein
VDEYVCITVLSTPGEPRAAFAARLSRFWTRMLRDRKPDFAKVYAETTAFEETAGRLSRQYLATADVVNVLEAEMTADAIDHRPIDAGEVYSKCEAVPPEWMQIEH